MKLKTPIVLLLSAGLIVFGALLPSLMGLQRDLSHRGEVYFATVSDVQLEFSESDVTLKETISILCSHEDSVEIPSELANLKPDRASDLALAIAKDLQDAGIAFEKRIELQELTNPVFYVAYKQTALATSAVSGISSIFWMVEVYSKDGTQQLTVIIDDRTGTVCSLDYHDEFIEYNQTRMKNILYSFCDLYLEELGEEFYDFDKNKILSSAKYPADNSYLASEISWWAEDYEYRTTFFVNSQGFYTYLAAASY